ncbi:MULTISPECIES: FliH/SctL family protein [unclassified Thermotoga]|uniref:FliH/SctL family protein n=1 Tax=unclassified Thermotoga TaxID=2631113 RepID=UPI000280E9A9|nr:MULTISPECIES: FliH/SctL family protein [unclassified Thermotoga]AIY86286.1 flagellar export/assembly protein [Thermotoga sp. 2812B]EJX26222.1 flagellar export/assembly protein [Thermotoga sp. EMP]
MLLRKDEVFYIDLPRKIEKEEKVQEEKTKENTSEEIQKIKEMREKILSEAQEEARKIIEGARKDAEEILRSASSEVETLKLEAKKVLEEAKTMRNDLQKYILGLKKEIQKQINLKIEEILPELLDILKILFKKILEKEMDESTVERKLRSALSKVVGIKNVKIRINPEDAKKLDLSEVSRETLIPDPNVERGGVIVETDFGILDKTFSHQWELVEDIFEEVVGFEGHPERTEKEVE